MKPRLVFSALFIFFLLSCNFGGLFNQVEEDESSADISVEPFVPEEDESSVDSPVEAFVPEEGEPLPPMLIGEEIACTLFVSPDGSDDGPGSESQPWETIQFAVDSAQAGDTVCFHQGNYLVEEAIQVTASGTAEAPLVFIAYPGESPVFDGGGAIGDFITIYPNSSYLRLSGFTLRGFNSWGLSLDGNNHHIQLDHLKIEGGEAGVHFTYGSDELGPPEGGPVEYITLEDSVIANSEYTGVDCTPGPCSHMVFRRVEVYGSGLVGEASFGSDGIAISRGYPVLVEDCYVHDNGGDGIDLNSRDHAGYAEGVIVRRNQVVRNRQNGIKLWAGGLIENNVVWGGGNSVLWLGTLDSILEVVNNTIAFNMWDPAYSGRNWTLSAGYPEDIVLLPQVDLTLVNNIFAFNSGPELGDPTGLFLGPGVALTEYNNLYFSNEYGEITAEYLDREFTRQEISDGTWTSVTGQGLGDVLLDPFFFSGWPQVDLRLLPDSPAIDAGDNGYCPEVDYLGNLRPLDGDQDGQAVCDIGAYEWVE